MKLEYLNGVRITKLLHEMSPLEAAINNYETLAEKHINRFQKMAKKHYAKDTTLTEDERKAELEASLKHLELERAKLAAISDVQGQLANYRASAMVAVRGSAREKDTATRRLANELHHPTDILEKYMIAEGAPKPSAKHTAHHVVPGKGKDEVTTGRTRLHLHRHGIGINDPANGVYLIHKDEDTPHWSMPKSRGHLTYHTIAYEGCISGKLRALTHVDSIKTQLQIIGRILQHNEPKNIPGVIRR